MEALRAEVASGEETLTDCLTSLGQEEAKVGWCDVGVYVGGVCVCTCARGSGRVLALHGSCFSACSPARPAVVNSSPSPGTARNTVPPRCLHSSCLHSSFAVTSSCTPAFHCPPTLPAADWSICLVPTKLFPLPPLPPPHTPLPFAQVARLVELLVERGEAEERVLEVLAQVRRPAGSDTGGEVEWRGMRCCTSSMSDAGLQATAGRDLLGARCPAALLPGAWRAPLCPHCCWPCCAGGGGGWVGRRRPRGSAGR